MRVCVNVQGVRNKNKKNQGWQILSTIRPAYDVDRCSIRFVYTRDAL